MPLAVLSALVWIVPVFAADLPGKALFDAAGCRACHSTGGKGGDAGPDLSFVGARQSREWLELWLRSPSAWKHDTKMPEFRLAEGERGAIVDYLLSLKGQDFTSLPWDRPGLEGVARGRVIYDRAGCVACHGAQGTGGHPENNYHGYLIPALKHVSDGYTLEELKKRIASGRKPEPQDASLPPPIVAMPAWSGVLKEDDIEDVAKYLMSLSPPTKGGYDF